MKEDNIMEYQPKYFTLAEFEHSDTATAKRIDNTIPESLKGNILMLIEKVLDPLREAYGKPITITSGYRCQKLNKAVGGSSTSDHMNGRAADIVGKPKTKDENRKLYDLIKSLGLEYDQRIDESNMSWVHISYREGNNRNQTLKL